MTDQPGPSGIGTPPSDHPGFTPPAGAGASRPPSWAPPPLEHRVEAPPPTGRRPGHPRRRSRRIAVAAVLVGGLLLVASLSALPMLSPSRTGGPNPGAGPALVTEGPSPAGTAAATVTGGGVGAAVPFTTAGGAGTITVTSAVWTDAGAMAAPQGRRYLVLDVTIACALGEVAVSPLALLAVTATEKELPGFGATIDRPLAGAVVSAGSSAAGQVGFALTPSTTRVYLLDESLHRLAEVEIPAP